MLKGVASSFMSVIFAPGEFFGNRDSILNSCQLVCTHASSEWAAGSSGEVDIFHMALTLRRIIVLV